MAIQYNKIFAIYDKTVGTDAARRLIWYYNGNYGTAGEADERPVAGVQYNSATEGWVALDSLTIVPKPAWAETGTVQTNTVYINVTAGTTSNVTEPASIQERQRAVQQLITSKIRATDWTQTADNKLTEASRMAFSSYRATLAAIPQAQSSTWSTNPENVTYPTEPTPAYAAMDNRTQNLPGTQSDPVLEDWLRYDGNTQGVTYPTSTGMTGTRVLRATGRSVGIQSPRRVRYDPTRSYRVTGRLKLIAAYAGTATYSIGVVFYDANGTAIGEAFPAGLNVAESALPVGSWVINSGYVKGTAGSAATNAGTLANPSVAPSGTVTIGARVRLNATSAGALTITSGASTIELDYVDIQATDDAMEGGQLIERTVARSKLGFGDLGTLMPEFIFDNPDATQFKVMFSQLSWGTTAGANSGGVYAIITKTTAAYATGTDPNIAAVPGVSPAGGWNSHLEGIPVNYVPVREGTTYSWSVDYKWMAGTWVTDGLAFQLKFYDANKRLLGEAGPPYYGLSGQAQANGYAQGDITVRQVTPITNDASWKRVDGKLTAPIGARYCTVNSAMLQTNPQGVQYGIDNFTLNRSLVADDIGDDEIDARHYIDASVSTPALEGYAATNTAASANDYASVNINTTSRGASAAYITGVGMSVRYPCNVLVVIEIQCGGNGGIWSGFCDVTRSYNGGAEDHFYTFLQREKPQNWGSYTMAILDQPNTAGTVTYRLRMAHAANAVPKIDGARINLFARWR